jgi:hypothetical protein
MHAIADADPLQSAGIKYQETHKRCPPNVVAIEYRLSEKCGKSSFPRADSSSCSAGHELTNVRRLPRFNITQLHGQKETQLGVHATHCRRFTKEEGPRFDIVQLSVRPNKQRSRHSRRD